MKRKYLPTLTIAGSDSSGGAGIQADIKAMSALGCYAMSVITTVTAQNTCGVIDIEAISPRVIAAQLKAVIDDIPPIAIKIGLLYNKEVIQTIYNSLTSLSYNPHIIIDPVMIATSGDKLIKDEAIEYLRTELLPVATLVTPNLPEAEVLAGVKINDIDDTDDAAKAILALGVKAVLIKGGHSKDNSATDILYTREGRVFFPGTKIHTSNTHGTGCTLSSAIAAYLARGENLDHAIRKAKVYLTEAIDSGKEIITGFGHGPVDHFYNPTKSIKV